MLVELAVELSLAAVLTSPFSSLPSSTAMSVNRHLMNLARSFRFAVDNSTIKYMCLKLKLIVS